MPDLRPRSVKRKFQGDVAKTTTSPEANQAPRELADASLEADESSRRELDACGTANPMAASARATGKSTPALLSQTRAVSGYTRW